MQKLRAAAFACGLSFLPLISPCQTAPTPQQGMQMCITGGGSGNVPGCPATSGPASVAGTRLDSAARDKLMREARQSYYNLPSRGLKEFSCQVQPAWDVMYNSKRQKVDGVERDQFLPVLKKVRFRVLVGARGAASVSHQSDVAAPSQAVAARVRESSRGIEQLVRGFFQTWSSFAFGSLFPEDSGGLQIEQVGEKFRLTHKGASTDVLIVMNKDLTIEHANVESSKASASMDPIFMATKEGLLLTNYDGKVSMLDRVWDTSGKISYQTVGGYQLPQVVNSMVGVPGGGQLPLVVTFVGCQVKGQ